MTGRLVRAVLHEHLPAAVRRRSGGSEITAEADQHAAAELVGDHRGAQVRGVRLRGRAEVEQCPGRHGQQPAVQSYVRPAGRASDGRPWRIGEFGLGRDTAGGPVGTVGVAEVPERATEGRVDGTLGGGRGGEGDTEQLGEQRAHRFRVAGAAGQPADLRAGPEPAGGRVDPGQLLEDQRDRLDQHGLGR